MSENITHTAIVDDCFRLMLASEEIGEIFKQVAREQKEAAHLGAITRKGDSHTVQLLTEFRARWEERSPEDGLESKLAFVMGWLCHRAADRQMKPVFREVEPPGEDRARPTHTSVYHDAFIFHEVYGGGKFSPYHAAMFQDRLEALPASQHLDVAAIEELIHVLVQRALVELHTFIPEETDIEAWIGGLLKVRQTFHVDRHRYAKAIAEPDPEWVKKAITDTHFYDRSDPRIAAARALQNGESITPERIREAAAAELDNPSHYEQALRTGYGYLVAASDFFRSEMSPKQLRERLDIGKKGRDGGVV